ncbi:unnamed protein product [Nezara viridula]|uniref:Uncharacterized protein n=1 Tax=Nezara viridula TaxID=85310 RepID=A0A9P0MTM5_NEZVI|nr:unnamed protein product [Nezara viridula]
MGNTVTICSLEDSALVASCLEDGESVYRRYKMPSGKHKKGPSGEDSEDESEVLEESPCGRWLKRREEQGRYSL